MNAPLQDQTTVGAQFMRPTGVRHSGAGEWGFFANLYRGGG